MNRALLQELLLPGAAGTVCMVISTALTIVDQSKVRYAAVDDNGKSVLPHPYRPWAPVPDGCKAAADKAYRAYKAYTNCVEWCLLSLPPFWLFAIYGGSIPYAPQQAVDTAAVATAIAWSVANSQYFKAYVHDAAARAPYFKIRTLVFRFWLYGSAAAIGCAGLSYFGVDLPGQ